MNASILEVVFCSNQGSSVFAHLVEKMIMREKAAIGRLITRVNTAPRLVALIPQFASFDEKRKIDIPCGFHVVILPFAEELRPILYPTIELPSPSHVEFAHHIIDSLSDCSFMIGTISNPGKYFPTHRKFWKSILQIFTLWRWKMRR